MIYIYKCVCVDFVSTCMYSTCIMSSLASKMTSMLKSTLFECIYCRTVMWFVKESWWFCQVIWQKPGFTTLNHSYLHTSSPLICSEVRECLKLDPDHKQCYSHYKQVKKLNKQIHSAEELIQEQRCVRVRVRTCVCVCVCWLKSLSETQSDLRLVDWGQKPCPLCPLLGHWLFWSLC